ncbi:hypothetical protein MGWOODY_Clf473 [hydrothermal vent metagenome]|uniref:Uncharacterized protein n=1 Tax=hydrothermal vent metagenome TaxID=652676 RepID=A0A170QAR1_9ZZZZ
MLREKPFSTMRCWRKEEIVRSMNKNPFAIGGIDDEKASTMPTIDMESP